RDHARRSRPRHPTLVELTQVWRQELQAVSVVAEQVTLNQNFRDDRGFGGLQSCLLEQHGSEAHEILGAITWCGGHSHLSLVTSHRINSIDSPVTRHQSPNQ